MAKPSHPERDVGTTDEGAAPSSETTAESAETVQEQAAAESAETAQEQAAAGDALATELESTRREYSQLHDKYLRLSAEFDNYKKRTAKDRDNYLQFGHEKLLKEWLFVVDNIERALHHAEEVKAPTSMVEGWLLILKQCQELLGRSGVTMIESVGKPFNPEVHQAIAQRETAEHGDQIVLEEAQRGYLLKGRILRPAMVVVSQPVTTDESPTRHDTAEADEEQNHDEQFDAGW